VVTILLLGNKKRYGLDSPKFEEKPMIEFDYDFVIENGLWLEDQGSRFSRYLLNDASVWVDHYETDIVNDPSDVE
jgi:hypothetical protein